MTKLRLLAVAAAGAAVLMASPVSAAPAGAGLGTASTAAGAGDVVQKVHWRRYRHCHRRYGRRRCHGGRRYYRSYGVLPGVGIYIGRRHHHYRHHRWHRRRR